MPRETPGTATRAPSATTPARPPTTLHADQAAVWRADPGRWSVVLTWLPAPDVEVDHYEVTRDGRLLDGGLVGTRLVDLGVLPETAYRYGVTAVDAEGSRTQTAWVAIETAAPAPRDARLQGRFRMQMRAVGQRGLRRHVEDGTMLFVFHPVCTDGPCDARWRRKGRVGSGRLLRDDAHYRGTAIARFQIDSCRGGRLNERIFIAMRVVAGGVHHGRWRATKIRGRLHETASGRGCMTARIHWKFAGFIQT